MPEILDTFPPSALDSTRWNSTLVGTSLIVNNRVQPDIVDAIGDEVLIDSSEKFSVPGMTSFDMSVMYSDITFVSDVALAHFFGWRTYREDEHGVSWGGVDILLLAKNNEIHFHRRSWVSGIEQRVALEQDNSLTSGGFRIVREGAVYILYFWNEEWIELERMTLGTEEPGYVVFGQFAESPDLEDPWVGSS